MKEVILLIEDEANICNAFSEALSEQDVSVVTAQTGELGMNSIVRTKMRSISSFSIFRCLASVAKTHSKC